MTELTREKISADVHDLGWRYILGRLCTTVGVGSLAEAADVATRIVAAAGPDADGRLAVDVRADRILLLTHTGGDTTEADLEIARRISALGLAFTPEVGADPRTVQLIEIAVDAINIPAVVPFWKAVFAYIEEQGALVDPYGQGPAIWFQQMEVARPQRNRIHFDVSVPHDEAQRRIAAALAAGGTMVNAGYAPSFWVLADPEGNEVCVCSWQGRD